MDKEHVVPTAVLIVFIPPALIHTLWHSPVLTYNSCTHLVFIHTPHVPAHTHL